MKTLIFIGKKNIMSMYRCHKCKKYLIQIDEDIHNNLYFYCVNCNNIYRGIDDNIFILNKQQRKDIIKNAKEKKLG